MNIEEIKMSLGYSTLQLNTATDKEGVKTEWMRHWDNDSRVAVSIHKDTVSAIQSNNPATLGIQSEIRTGAKGDYTAKRIVMFDPAEVEL